VRFGENSLDALEKERARGYYTRMGKLALELQQGLTASETPVAGEWICIDRREIVEPISYRSGGAWTHPRSRPHQLL
jgi:hypothetical protein